MITKQFKEWLKTVVLNYWTYMLIIQADIKKIDSYPTTEDLKAAPVWRIKKIITDKTVTPWITEELFPLDSNWKVDTWFNFIFNDVESLTFK